jgi:hypothetical protein
MNQHDRDNLNFLMSVGPKVLKDWYTKMSADDIEYALELLNIASREVDERALALRIDCELERMNNKYPDARRAITDLLKK